MTQLLYRSEGQIQVRSVVSARTGYTKLGVSLVEIASGVNWMTAFATAAAVVRVLVILIESARIVRLLEYARSRLTVSVYVFIAVMMLNWHRKSFGLLHLSFIGPFVCRL